MAEGWWQAPGLASMLGVHAYLVPWLHMRGNSLAAGFDIQLLVGLGRSIILEPRKAPTGGHIILLEDNHNATPSVREHKAVIKGTLQSLVRAAAMTVEESIRAM